MSGKPKPIFGPDGKPLDIKAMRAKTEPEPHMVVTNVTSPIVPNYKSDALYTINFNHEAATTPRTLADRVADDVAALTADLDFAGQPELPTPPRDLSTYEDAMAQARTLCPHDTIEDTIHARNEVFCVDCQRYLSHATYRREREARSPGFGSLFRRWFG